MKSWTFWGFAASWLLAGCDTAPAETEQATVAPPLCSQVASFGNGATCSASEPSLSSCGSSAKRTCAGQWLCFDAPEYASCACQVDSDCANRTAYINTARTANGKAPLSSSCKGGRCAGIP
ncbi:MAG: hypothetical protein HY902_01980 [Deltaproteobacteria bacterium]|nr:hypothetical protein [Deltaproteobacteria bacterium]